jgi:Protein of unknown function (DUF3800)
VSVSWVFFAMPRKPWVPLPHEANLFTEVYIDESSQTKHRYLVLGALLIPLSLSSQFAADIIAARGDRFPPNRLDGTPRIFKWEKANAYNLEAYKRVANAFFRFAYTHRTAPLALKVKAHCVVVDMSIKVLHDRKFSGGDVDLGFNKDIYHLCVRDVGRRYKKELFHVYPDRRNTNMPLHESMRIMNNGMKKHGDTRPYPFRRLKFADPETSQALQVIDILIGALAYRLNGHYQKPEANPAKKVLCDFILTKARITDVFRQTIFSRQLTFWHRDYRTLRES